MLKQGLVVVIFGALAGGFGLVDLRQDVGRRRSLPRFDLQGFQDVFDVVVLFAGVAQMKRVVRLQAIDAEEVGVFAAQTQTQRMKRADFYPRQFQRGQHGGQSLLKRGARGFGKGQATDVVDVVVGVAQ